MVRVMNLLIKAVCFARQLSGLREVLSCETTRPSVVRCNPLNDSNGLLVEPSAREEPRRFLKLEDEEAERP